jgi:hypothetical protein
MFFKHARPAFVVKELYKMTVSRLIGDVSHSLMWNAHQLVRAQSPCAA